MTTVQMLAVRTNAALGRLASLQRRAERIALPAASVVRPALKELSDALEELKVANEQLQAQLDDLLREKASSVAAQRRFADLLQVLPCACVWTNQTGEITDANPAAATLLNVSRQHLIGRPLLLFVSDRSGFQTALTDLSTGAEWTSELESEVRPRERRARAARLLGRRLNGDDQLCWFLLELEVRQARPRNGSVDQLSSL